MSPIKACLSTLCLTYEDAAELLPHNGRAVSVTMVKDWARGKSRVPAAVFEQLAEYWEAVENAADEIIADQGERDGGKGLSPLTVRLSEIDLPSEGLRAAAGQPNWEPGGMNVVVASGTDPVTVASTRKKPR